MPHARARAAAAARPEPVPVGVGVGVAWRGRRAAVSGRAGEAFIFDTQFPVTN